MHFLKIVLIASLGLGFTANAQEVGKSPTPTEEELISEMRSFGQQSPVGFATVMTDWNEVIGNGSPDEVSKTLKNSGWDMETLSAAVPMNGDVSLYSRVLGPGVKGYLVVPQGGGKPIELSPKVQSVGFFGYSREDVREELVGGMNDALIVICGLEVKPAEIRVKASAVGVLEIELMWQTAEICDKLAK